MLPGSLPQPTKPKRVRARKIISRILYKTDAAKHNPIPGVVSFDRAGGNSPACPAKGVNDRLVIFANSSRESLERITALNRTGWRKKRERIHNLLLETAFGLGIMT